jgi:hypothetical protein
VFSRSAAATAGSLFRYAPSARSVLAIGPRYANSATRIIQTRLCVIAQWLEFRSLVVLSPQTRGLCPGPVARSTTPSPATPIDAASNSMATIECAYAGTRGFRWLAELQRGPASAATKRPGRCSSLWRTDHSEVRSATDFSLTPANGFALGARSILGTGVDLRKSGSRLGLIRDRFRCLSTITAIAEGFLRHLHEIRSLVVQVDEAYG